MVIDVSLVHWENTLFPILVTPLGMVNEVRPEQPVNAEFPSEVTPLGIVTPVI